MVATAQELGPATRRAHNTLARHAGMLTLLEIGPDDIGKITANFDLIINAYNEGKWKETPYMLRFLGSKELNGLRLKTTQEMLTNSSARTCIMFQQALHTMSPLMTRAEQKEAEPNLGFAIWNPDRFTPSERLLGGIIQVYGLTIAHEEHGLKVSKEDYPSFYSWKDHLLDALLEVSALEHQGGNTTLLFELAQKQGWFEAQSDLGDPIFTEDIRGIASGNISPEVAPQS